MKIDPLYILPNLFTGASIYLGILSVSYATMGKFHLACWLVLLSLIFDGLDGRVARLTGTTSKFGVEFDSLADVVAFGVAPAMILFCYVGYMYGKLGIIVSGLYVVFGAIRLARFNVTTTQNGILSLAGLLSLLVLFILSPQYGTEALLDFACIFLSDVSVMCFTLSHLRSLNRASTSLVRMFTSF